MFLALATTAMLAASGAALPIAGGLAAGAGHALTGPDHLAAVAPLAARDPSHGFRIGVSWGLGHGLGVVVLGAIAILARGIIDAELLSHHAEGVVGLVLVLTGLWSLARAGEVTEHTDHSHASLGLGTLHGLAGGAHLVVLLGALALPLAGAVGWLLAFLFGAAFSMGGAAHLMGRLGGHLSHARARLLRQGIGLAVIAVGVAWAWQAWG